MGGKRFFLSCFTVEISSFICAATTLQSIWIWIYWWLGVARGVGSISVILGIFVCGCRGCTSWNSHQQCPGWGSLPFKLQVLQMKLGICAAITLMCFCRLISSGVNLNFWSRDEHPWYSKWRSSHRSHQVLHSVPLCKTADVDPPKF